MHKLPRKTRVLAYCISTLFIVLLVLVITLCCIIAFKIDVFSLHKRAFKPNHPPNSRTFAKHPSEYNLTYEEIMLNTSDNVRLHSYFFKQNYNSTIVPTLIYFHGNDGNIGRRLSQVKHILSECECNMFTPEYRGYGFSEGVPSEEGLYEDARTAVKYMKSRNDIDVNNIYLYGSSLGGAVAIDAANYFGDNVRGLIVMNTFSSVSKFFKANYPILSFLPDAYFSVQLNNIKKIALIDIPTYFISSRKDEITPAYMMDELYESGKSKFKRMLYIKEGKHGFAWSFDGFNGALVTFLKQSNEFRLASNNSNSTYEKWEI